MKPLIQLKALLITIYLLGSFNFLYAQCQADWLWTKGIIGDNEDKVHAMTVDKWNNIYIAGETFSNKLIIDSFSMTTGNADYFIKFNSDGKLLWAKRFGGVNIKGMVTDKYGNVYLAGIFWTSPAKFDQVQLTKNTGNTLNAFLVKYSPEGNAIWGVKAYQASNGTLDLHQGIAIDSVHGNVILSGWYSGDFIKSDNVEIKHSTKNLYNAPELFLYVYDSLSNIKYGRSIYSENGEVFGKSVSADLKGNIYLGGYYIVSIKADTFTRVNGYESNMFIVKLDEKGKVKWIKNSSRGNVIPGYLQVDIDGNVIASGTMNDTIINIENNIYKGLIGKAGMIMKIDSIGNINWIKRILGSYPNQEWPDGEQHVFSTATDAIGNIYAVGKYRKDSLIIDNHHFYKTGGTASTTEPFYLKFDRDGNFKWLQRVYLTDTIKQFSSFGNDNDARVVVDHFGQVYVLNTWSFYTIKTGKHGIIVKNDTISTLDGTLDVFVGKIYNELGASVKSYNTTCYNTQNGKAKVYISGGTPPYNIQWSNSSNQQELINLSPGWYTVTVTDAMNCKYKDSVEITSPQQLYISITTKHDSAGMHKGEATAIVSGGVPPYTYLWNDAAVQKNQKATGLVKGNYTVAITDKNGCTTDTTISISDITAIEDLMPNNILIYPNPVKTGRLNLKIMKVPRSGLNIRIYDSAGKQVIYKDIQGTDTYYKDQFDLNVKGFYLVKVEIGGDVFTKNIVVQ